MKVFHKPIRLLLTLCLLAQLLLIPSFAADAPVYLALGDSISTGYGLSETDPGFVEQLADCYPDFTLVNEAVNGNTPAGVYEQLKDGALDSYLTSAKLITLTCGGNDMMGSLYEKIANLYNEKHPSAPIEPSDVVNIFAGRHPTLGMMDLLVEAMKAINGFSQSAEFEARLQEFTTALSQVMAYIREKNPSAEVVVATQYNPYTDFNGAGMYGRIYTEVEAGAIKLNDEIKALAEPLGYTYADVYTAFHNSSETLCNAKMTDNGPDLDFHPNAAGHTLIKDVILDLNLIPSFGINETKSSLADGTVAVSLTAVDAPVNVVAAFYNRDNRMIGSDMVTLTESNLQTTLSAKFLGTAFRVQVFLLSDSSFIPLHQALNWSGN